MTNTPTATGRVKRPSSEKAKPRPCTAFALLAALTAFGISPRRTATVAPVKAADLPVPA